MFDKVAYTHIADGQQFEMKGFDALLAAHGGIVGKNGGNSTWRMDNRVGAALLYDWLHDRGLIIRRIPDITSDLVKGYVTTATGTTNSEHVMATLYNRASEALDYAIAIGANPMMVRMYTANTLNRIVEGSKADFAIEVAKGELTKGNRVVVFTEGRSERRMDMWGVKQDDNVRVEYPSEQIVEMYEASGGEHPGISDTLYKLAQAFLARDLNDVLPSVITQMENALREYGVSIYTGGVHHGQALKTKMRLCVVIPVYCLQPWTRAVQVCRCTIQSASSRLRKLYCICPGQAVNWTRSWDALSDRDLLLMCARSS